MVRPRVRRSGDITIGNVNGIRNSAVAIGHGAGATVAGSGSAGPGDGAPGPAPGPGPAGQAPARRGSVPVQLQALRNLVIDVRVELEVNEHRGLPVPVSSDRLEHAEQDLDDLESELSRPVRAPDRIRKLTGELTGTLDGIPDLRGPLGGLVAAIDDELDRP